MRSESRGGSVITSSAIAIIIIISSNSLERLPNLPHLQHCVSANGEGRAGGDSDGLAVTDSDAGFGKVGAGVDVLLDAGEWGG